MEEETRPVKKRSGSMLYIVLASFIMGSFSGAAFGVLFALSLGDRQLDRQLLLDIGSTIQKEERTVLAEELLQCLDVGQRRFHLLYRQPNLLWFSVDLEIVHELDHQANCSIHIANVMVPNCSDHPTFEFCTFFCHNCFLLT